MEDDDDDDDDDRPAGLTECSLSSSVVPRSEGMFAWQMLLLFPMWFTMCVLYPIPVLTLLDNRFEKVSHLNSGTCCFVHLSVLPHLPPPLSLVAILCIPLIFVPFLLANGGI